jgi:hypothetical protein
MRAEKETIWQSILTKKSQMNPSGWPWRVVSTICRMIVAQAKADDT